MAHYRPSSFRFEDYKVGIICALPKELLAIRALFDETHEGLRTVKEDTMHYSLGRMGRHLVATACLPSGEYGTNSSSAAMQNMRRTFPQLESCLFVGIGGGVPSSGNDIRLGDVVVSHPVGRYPAVVQYDMGKMLQSGIFETTGTLQPPPRLLMTAIAGLRSDPNPNASSLQEHLSKISVHWPLYRFPGRDQDVLFAAHSPHLTADHDCRHCQGVVVDRSERVSDEPQIFYGPIGSGNQVIKSAEHRDLLWQRHKILCFEMDAAGVMNTFSCLIIRGICDYSDSHKSKGWQEYAAAAAAAYAKLLLSVLRDHNDIIESMGPFCQTQSEPNPIVLPVSDNQRTTLVNDLSSNNNDTYTFPRDGAELLGSRNSHQELVDQSAILQALQPDQNPEDALQQCFLLARRSPSWNPWPKDRDSFQLFQSLSRWISDPACSLLIVRGTPRRLLHEHPESEIFASSVIQFLQKGTDFPVIWALSSGVAGNQSVDPMKAIISQGLPLCSKMIRLPNILVEWGKSQTPTEAQLFELMHDIICHLPLCFIVIEIKNASLATKMKNVVERAVQYFEGNLKAKILMVGYDIPWGNNTCLRIQNSIMPSIRLRGSQPGWDPCWNKLKPRFA
ncbi:hypothetical protein N7540_005479 [Penicillium herquei]|nr:hypothetical protein N7540_005479 [Penicillium herquei]